ncbi:MAG: flagellar biosynthetic protein FliO [Proteobacteria bacterium]|nr:flagellar biosynthetic protein FliO [Pseudomonadota bacterium]
MSGGGYGWGALLFGGAVEGLGADLGGALLRMVLALLAVCALAWLVLRVGLPRLLKTLRLPAAEGGALRVIERQVLSVGKTLWLVEVEGRRLLIGASEGGLRLITEVSTPPRAPAGRPVEVGPHGETGETL